MALTKTPVCDFGKKAEDFKLKSIENKLISLNDVKGKKATLIMFICNHCPYVKAIIRDLAQDCNELKKDGINTVAIMSNDTKNYPEDSFDNMIKFAKANDFGEMNYLIDETQEIARKYGAVCTPDFFGYNKDLNWYLRKIEEIIIKILGAFNINCHSRKGFTGVWIGNKKIASIGIGCKRWITINGFSINVDCELENFNKIVPCGIENCLMANMIDYNKNFNIQEVKRIVKKIIQEEFNFDFVSK